ncbi:MAG TPA: PAC2 family protein [Micromonosporaceae bacterium]|nr:PAC2 family protein [Micromonosporaceae bacterium]
MLDPDDLYEVAPELPELDRPVLVQAMTGFVDAGSATRLAAEHLLRTGNPQVVATFDIDQLLDYRSRRPLLDFREDHWESYDEPRLALHLLHDDDAMPFLLLSGPEPDLQWERFIAALQRLVEQLGVRLTVGLNAIPMAVPHTRPGGVIAHATRPELIAGHEAWVSSVRVPASAGHLLEYRLGQRGHDALGFAVHVPHYLAQNEYPAAAELLLTSVSRATGLLLPTGPLHDAAAAMRAEVDEQVAQAEEATALVRGLEQQYDAYVRGRTGPDLLASAGPLPTADQLGAELERFLADRARPGDGPA